MQFMLIFYILDRVNKSNGNQDLPLEERRCSGAGGCTMGPFPAVDVTTDDRDREMKSGGTGNGEVDGKCARACTRAHAQCVSQSDASFGHACLLADTRVR